MSRGFLAIDRAALALCMSDDEALCLFMMMRAQDAAWSPKNPEPFVSVGRSYWPEKCGLTEGNFRQLIDRLVQAGRAVVVHPGDRRTTKQIRFVVDIDPPTEKTHPPTFPPSTNSEQRREPPNPANPPPNLRPTSISNTPETEPLPEDPPPPPLPGGRADRPKRQRARDPWDGTLPSWVPELREIPGETREDVCRAVLATLRVVHHGPAPLDGSPDERPEVNPLRCKTDADVVLRFWRTQGKVGERPPLAEFAADIELVAHAARGCPDGRFARDIRAEGWAEGRNRMDEIATICRREAWDTRLRVARAWRERGYPTGLRPDWVARHRGGTSAPPDPTGRRMSASERALAGADTS